MDQKLVTIDTFTNSIDANISKGKLESENITCFLKNDTIIGNTGLHVTYGGIELVVKEEDTERAKAVLDIPKNS